MAGIEFLKDWDIKKHGLTGLIVALLFVVLEMVLPSVIKKDPSCENQVKFLQGVVDRQEGIINKKDSIQNDLEHQLFEKNNIINEYQNVVKPYKKVIKEKDDER